MDQNKAVAALGALAQDTRLGLFRLLVTLIIYAIYGLIVGGLLAFLGSLLALSRSKP